MPTEITGQNGALHPQQTKIALTGCGAGAKASTGTFKKHSIKGAS